MHATGPSPLMRRPRSVGTGTQPTAASTRAVRNGPVISQCTQWVSAPISRNVRIGLNPPKAGRNKHASITNAAPQATHDSIGTRNVAAGWARRCRNVPRAWGTSCAVLALRARDIMSPALLRSVLARSTWRSACSNCSGVSSPVCSRPRARFRYESNP